MPTPPTALAPAHRQNTGAAAILSKNAAVLVLALGLLVTAVAWWESADRAERRVQEQFEIGAETVLQDLRASMLVHVQGLRGAVGMVSSLSRLPTRREWRHYVEALDLPHNFAGAHGLGLAVRVHPDEKSAHESAARAEGMWDYAITPAGIRDTYTAITHFEPFDVRNRRILGYDMFAEPVRNAAMTRARDSGLPALSAIVQLVQETNVAQSGFLIYVPVYRKWRALDTTEQRRDAVLAYVFSPYPARDILHDIVGKATRDNAILDLAVFDGNGSTDPARIIYDSAEPGVPHRNPDDRGPRFSRMLSKSLRLAGHTWTLQFRSRPLLETTFRSRTPHVVAGSGLLLSVLVFGLLWTLARQRDRVASEARSMTRELRENRTRLETLTESAHDAILSANRDGRITYLNPAAERMFGLTSVEGVGTAIGDLIGDQESVVGSAARQPIAGTTGITERVGRRIDGTEFPIEISIAAWQTDAGSAVSAIVRDITERRNAEEQMRMGIDNAPNAMLRISDDGRIALANREARYLLGYDEHELVGQSVEMLLPVAMRMAHSAKRAAFRGENMPRRMGAGRGLTALHKNGTAIPVEIGLSPIVTSSGRSVLVSLLDISERKHAERRMTVENAIARILADAESSPDAVTAVIRTLAEAYGWECGAFWQTDTACSRLLLGDRWCDTTELEALYAVTTEIPVTPGAGIVDGIAHPTWQTNTAHWVADVRADGGTLRAVEWAAAGICSGVAFPINVGALRLGIMELFSRRPQAPQDAQLAALTSFGLQIAHYCKRKQVEQDLWITATRDALTDLPNRASFRDVLSAALSRAHRHSGRLALMFIDLDRFKTVNDTLGHEAGDAMLCSIAQRLKRATRDSDTVARLGGDEFVVLAEQCDDIDHLGQIAGRILQDISAPMNCVGHTLHASASIGISVFPDDGADAATLLRHADIAMYRAKDEGRNQFRFFSVDMNSYSLDRLALEEDLRVAAARQEFELYYQPKADLLTGRITGVEALIRWNSPTRGMVPPGDFIPLAEETGLILAIGQWALRAACRQGRAWQLEGLPRTRIAVNLSATQFTQELVAQVWSALAAADLDPEWLEIEVTESMIMRNPAQAAQLLSGLRSLRVHTAMDDFGTGYSSLGALKRLPLDALKVDRSLIKDLPGDAGDVAICRAIIAMAQALQLRVVAEGVETEAQRDLLREIGCHEMQGYVLSRPLPATACAALLRTADASRLRLMHHAG